jgi:type IV secretory pathway TrbL component
MFEVKAHMIERKPEAKGILDRLLDPFTHVADWLVSGVRKHPLIVVLVLLALLFLAWRLNK